MECTEDIEGGENEEGQAHALCFIGGVSVWEVGFQAAEPVFDVLFFVQGGMGDGGGHCFFMLRTSNESIRLGRGGQAESTSPPPRGQTSVPRRPVRLQL